MKLATVITYHYTQFPFEMELRETYIKLGTVN